MSFFQASDGFAAGCMRAAFLAKVDPDDYALAWSVWCMGGEL